MNRKFIGIIFGLPILALAFWGAILRIQMNSGFELKLPITGYDPRDLLSGHYIQYQIDWNKVDCTLFEEKECPEDNFCVEGRWGGRQCRFYIPEEYAKKLDNLFRKKNSEDLIFEVVYSYKKGFNPIAKELLINGKKWNEFM